ncbi:hypothetical protein BZZ01_19920 [Nostocales cyanobacterium HT-58-2]|nr:hypothetical protein BZZ01_19920 [Nostocales cyanobacterium HT-58-2]
MLLLFPRLFVLWVFLGVQLVRPRPHSSKQHKPKFQSKLPGWSRTYVTDPKNRQLQRVLKGMLHYDISTARRLLKQQRQLHPGQSDNWYLEKVIHDLERDRH